MEDKASRILITEASQKQDAKQIQFNKRVSKPEASKEELKILNSDENDHKVIEMNDDYENNYSSCIQFRFKKEPLQEQSHLQFLQSLKKEQPPPPLSHQFIITSHQAKRNTPTKPGKINICGEKKVFDQSGDFKTIMEKKCFYFDKTLFIKNIIDQESQNKIFCRPSRAGKSLTLSTMEAFYSIPIDQTLKYKSKDINNQITTFQELVRAYQCYDPAQLFQSTQIGQYLNDQRYSIHFANRFVIKFPSNFKSEEELKQDIYFSISRYIKFFQCIKKKLDQFQFDDELQDGIQGFFKDYYDKRSEATIATMNSLFRTLFDITFITISVRVIIQSQEHSLSLKLAVRIEFYSKFFIQIQNFFHFKNLFIQHKFMMVYLSSVQNAIRNFTLIFFRNSNQKIEVQIKKQTTKHQQLPKTGGQISLPLFGSIAFSLIYIYK